jgi:hypothetical protein
VRTLPRPTRLLALLLALLLPLAAACGGDDDSSDDSSGGSPDTEQEGSAPADDEADASSETTEAAAEPGDDALSAAIEAQSEALGIEDVVQDGDDITLVMADGTDDDAVQAACAFGAQLNPDANLSVDVGGEVTSCP